MNSFIKKAICDEIGTFDFYELEKGLFIVVPANNRAAFVLQLTGEYGEDKKTPAHFLGRKLFKYFEYAFCVINGKELDDFIDGKELDDLIQFLLNYDQF